MSLAARARTLGLALIASVWLALSAEAQQPTRELIDAVRRRDEAAVLRLLSQRVDVDAAQPDGATALAWAVHLGERRMADALIDAGARVNVADEYGETPLTLAAANGDVALMQRLLDRGARPDASRWNGETALMIAAGAGSVAGVRLLVQHGAPIDAAEPRGGQTALMWAAAERHTAVVRLLIELGADVQSVSRAGFSALAFAVSKNDVESVQALLVAGLDPNLLLPSGNRLLTVALNFKHRAAAMALVDGGADVNVADRSGSRPLHTAAQSGDVELVRKLLSKGADVDVRTAPVRLGANRARAGGGVFNGGGMRTPLMIAAQANHLDVMRALVDAGADPLLRSDSDSTLLMFAAGGTRATVEYAHELDSRVSAVDKLGRTPMHASISGALQRTQAEVCDVIQFLADKGAALDELDAAGRTALSIADGPPRDKAVALLTSLIVKSGKTPKIPSRR